MCICIDTLYYIVFCCILLVPPLRAGECKHHRKAFKARKAYTTPNLFLRGVEYGEYGLLWFV